MNLKVFQVFTNGHSRCLFSLYSSFSTVNSKPCSVENLADDCIQTANLWYRKQLLCQLSHNHCQNFPSLIIQSLNSFIGVNRICGPTSLRPARAAHCSASPGRRHSESSMQVRPLRPLFHTIGLTSDNAFT